MTHAYLQQLYGSSIKPHGKEFRAKILEINIALDLDITTHHSYLKWWRCDGVCQKQELHYFGYLSGVDEHQLFASNQSAVKLHERYCGGKFSRTEEPSSEMQSELRRIKRKRKSTTRVVTFIVGGERDGQVYVCDKKKDDKNLSRHDAPKKLKITKYSTDSGDE
jgi:hypothetical protein